MIRVGPSVRPRRVDIYVNLGIIKLSYWFQTLHGDFYNHYQNVRKSILNMLIFYFFNNKGIRQWPINWCTSQMMMHKITHS